MINKVHFIWVGDPMPESSIYEYGLRSNLAFLEELGYEVIIHVSDSSLVKSEFSKYLKVISKELIDKYSNLDGVVNSKGELVQPHLCDCLRYEVLLEYGGLYLDCDDILLVDPKDFIDSSKINLLIETARVITNSIIYSPETNNWFFKDLLDRILAGKIRKSWIACTGPYLITEYLAEYYKDDILECSVHLDRYKYPRTEEVRTLDIYSDFNLLRDTISPMKMAAFQSSVRKGRINLDQYLVDGYQLFGSYGSESSRTFKEDRYEVEYTLRGTNSTVVYGEGDAHE